VLIERWREHYDRVRPHSALGYRPSAPGGYRCWTGLRFAPARRAAAFDGKDYCVNYGLTSGKGRGNGRRVIGTADVEFVVHQVCAAEGQSFTTSRIIA